MERPSQKSRPGPNFEGYLAANLALWGFLVLVWALCFILCGAVWDEVAWGTAEFLFAVMGGGVALASLLDYFYEERLGQTSLEGRP